MPQLKVSRAGAQEKRTGKPKDYQITQFAGKAKVHLNTYARPIMRYNAGPHPPLRFVVPFHRLRENRPPRPWGLRDPLPQLVDLTTYKRIHRQRDDQLKWYLECGRKDWQSMPHSVWEYLLNRNAHVLAACNAEARIAVAETACAAFEEHHIAERGPLHFVTFAPTRFVYPIETAHRFDPRQLTGMVRQALKDVPAFGFVEAALYIGWGADGPALHRRFVCWHVHFIVWSVTRNSLQVALQTLRDRHSNMVGRTPVWVAEVFPHQVAQKVVYMAKGQLKEYRIRWVPGEEVDDVTGVITLNSNQQKRWMRHGEHVRMCCTLRDYRIDDLFFGNGLQGTWLAGKVRYEARRPFCDWARHENAAAAYHGRGEPYPEVEHNHMLGLRLKREFPACF